MARTTLADVWVPETFASYQINDPIRQTALVSSGILSVSPLLQDAASGAGFLTTAPFCNPIDSSLEPNYSNDVYTDIADPQKITAGEMTMRVSDLNEGWSSADLVATLVGKDPLKQVAAQIDGYWQEQLQRRLIATAIGVYNDNVTDNGGDMVVNKSSADMTVTDANLFGASAIVAAQLTLGDRMGKMAGIALHSVVYARMVENDMIQYMQDSKGALTIPTYMGMYVIVDDGMPVIGGDGTTVAFKYLTILFGRGAFGYGAGTPKVPFEYEREASRANGGGFETLWVRKRWIIHPMGYDFKSVTITGPGYSPTWADLKLDTNWERKLARKNVPLAFLVTNG
jgi:hypothetical protein